MNELNKRLLELLNSYIASDISYYRALEGMITATMQNTNNYDTHLIMLDDFISYLKEEYNKAKGL